MTMNSSEVGTENGMLMYHLKEDPVYLKPKCVLPLAQPKLKSRPESHKKTRADFIPQKAEVCTVICPRHSVKEESIHESIVESMDEVQIQGWDTNRTIVTEIEETKMEPIFATTPQ